VKGQNCIELPGSMSSEKVYLGVPRPPGRAFATRSIPQADKVTVSLQQSGALFTYMKDNAGCPLILVQILQLH
ncbi:MAG: hypothetical protein WBH03_17920, partial [Cyclobacteriaceae bacterium]